MAHPTQNSARPLNPHKEVVERRGRMMSANPMQRAIAVALLALAMPLAAVAQQNVQVAPEGEPMAGKTWDGYIVHQSIEFGGRIVEVDSNEQMYDTLINLHSGPRLLGQELIMRSPTRDHGLFDSLYLNSFGFGGDPNNIVRLRVEKGRWYDFVGLYRRDKNFFDVNYFANPLNLNPGIGTALQPPPAVVTFDPTTQPWFDHSPHLQDTTRNMGDFQLTLFPDSAIRVRLGYARNVTDGRVDTNLRSPIVSLLTEHNRWRSDRYQFGIDFRVLRRTTFSIDQFFEHDRVDHNFVNNNLSWLYNSATVPPGTLVDIGVQFPPAGCTIAPTTTFTVDPVTGATIFTPTAGCNIGLFSFNRAGNVRSDIPTTQLSFASNYFRKLDVTASGTYSAGHSEFLNYQEFVNLANIVVPTPAAKRPTLITGRTDTDRVSASADFGLTYHFTPSWSASDRARWFNWRIPGGFDRFAFFCTATPAPGLTPDTAGCTVPNLGSTNVFETYLSHRLFENTAKLHYNRRRFGGYAGFRYQRRELTGSPSGDSLILNSYYLVTDGAEAEARYTTKLNEYTGLGGVSFRPTPAWRINADVELIYNDNNFTNIAPRHQQRVRLNTIYKVKRWASVNGSVHFVETRNDFARHINAESTVFAPFDPANPNLFPPGVNPAYGHKNHWRYFTFGASLNPNPRFALDFGWTYLDQLIISDTCVPVGAAVIVPPGADAPAIPPGLCVTPFSSPPGATADVPLTLHYQERTHSGFFVVTVKPMHRVALNLGYEVTSTAGHNRWLMAGGVNGTGELLVLADIFGNSPPILGNPIAPCPEPSVAVTGGCAFPGPFPDAPLSQALNWHKPYAGVAVDITKHVTFKGLYAYYGFNEKETRGLPIVNRPRDFDAHTGTLSLKYAF